MASCIVCGVDDSAASRRAAAMAARLARDLHARAVLVSVSDAPGFFDRLSGSRFSEARRRRKELRALAAEHCFPERSDIRTEAGDQADKLIAVADREDAELLVIASRPAADTGPGSLGGIPSTLMGMAPCPVVVVPPAAIPPLEQGGIRAVVCGVAGDEADRDVLRLAADLASRLAASLHAVHAAPSRAQLAAVGKGIELPPDDEVRRRSERELASAVGDAGVVASKSVLPLPAADALQRVADRERAGLVVVGSRARRELGSMQQGSVASQLAGKGSTALVALPPGARLEPGSRHYRGDRPPDADPSEQRCRDESRG